jgi:hypothetical protein
MNEAEAAKDSPKAKMRCVYIENRWHQCKPNGGAATLQILT